MSFQGTQLWHIVYRMFLILLKHLMATNALWIRQQGRRFWHLKYSDKTALSQSQSALLFMPWLLKFGGNRSGQQRYPGWFMNKIYMFDLLKYTFLAISNWNSNSSYCHVSLSLSFGLGDYCQLPQEQGRGFILLSPTHVADVTYKHWNVFWGQHSISLVLVTGQ